jgi:hypothetical protein
MGKTYYPPKTFDDDLAGLVNLYKAKKWAFSGVDLALLAKDVSAQRSERTSHDQLEAEFSHVHETFGQAQEQRYQRFSAALNAARGAFRNDKAVMALLDSFKRSTRRAPRSSAKAPAPPKSGTGG